MKEFGDYVHIKGFKFGIQSAAAQKSYFWESAGSYTYEESDINTFSSWGVDYLRYDGDLEKGVTLK